MGSCMQNNYIYVRNKIISRPIHKYSKRCETSLSTGIGERA